MPPEKTSKIDRAIYEVKLQLRNLEQDNIVLLAKIKQQKEILDTLETINESKQFEP
jgi:hypothetical protein